MNGGLALARRSGILRALVMASAMALAAGCARQPARYVGDLDGTAPFADPIQQVAAFVERENLQRRLESDLESRVRAVAEGVVGRGNARVYASVELDWSAQRTTRRELVPDPVTGRGHEVGREADAEDYTAETHVPAGRAPAYEDPVYYTRRRSSISRSFGESIVERTESGPRTVRQTVCILINEAAVPYADEATVRRIAESVAGFDRERGDTLVIQRVPFGAAGGPARAGLYVIAGVLLLVGLLAPALATRAAAARGTSTRTHANGRPYTGEEPVRTASSGREQDGVVARAEDVAAVVSRWLAGG